MKKALVIFLLLFISLACGGSGSDNTNVEGNRPVSKTFNGQPLDNSGKPIPGIPDPKKAIISDQPPGATPTPGIPEPGKADITNQKGATPTPGIPDEATRKKMIEQIKRNPNAVNTAPANAPERKSSKRGPLNRPRKAQP